MTVTIVMRRGHEIKLTDDKIMKYIVETIGKDSIRFLTFNLPEVGKVVVINKEDISYVMMEGVGEVFGEVTNNRVGRGDKGESSSKKQQGMG